MDSTAPARAGVSRMTRPRAADQPRSNTPSIDAASQIQDAIERIEAWVGPVADDALAARNTVVRIVTEALANGYRLLDFSNCDSTLFTPDSTALFATLTQAANAASANQHAITLLCLPPRLAAWPTPLFNDATAWDSLATVQASEFLGTEIDLGNLPRQTQAHLHDCATLKTVHLQTDAPMPLLINCPDASTAGISFLRGWCEWPAQSPTHQRRSSLDLLRAAEQNDLDAMRAALATGADPNIATARGMTPLMFAAANNACDAMQALIDEGADVNAASFYFPIQLETTALAEAVKANHLKAARLLVATGADVNAPVAIPHGTTSRMTALCHATSTDMVNLLLSAGALVLSVGALVPRTPALLSSPTFQPLRTSPTLQSPRVCFGRFGDGVAVPQELLENKDASVILLPPEAREALQPFLLHCARADANTLPDAVREICAAVAQGLVSASGIHPRDDALFRALHAAFTAWSNAPDNHLTKLSVESALVHPLTDPLTGAEVQLLVSTPLAHAAAANACDAVTALLDAGHNPNLCGRTQSTPLLHAIVNGCVEMVAMLLARGTHANTGLPSFDNPLWRVALSKHLPAQSRQDMLTLLLSHGANPNTTYWNAHGHPLSLLGQADPAAIGLLLAHGARLTRPPLSPTCALHERAMNRDYAGMAMLLTAGAVPQRVPHGIIVTLQSGLVSGPPLDATQWAELRAVLGALLPLGADLNDMNPTECGFGDPWGTPGLMSGGDLTELGAEVVQWALHNGGGSGWRNRPAAPESRLAKLLSTHAATMPQNLQASACLTATTPPTLEAQAALRIAQSVIVPALRPSLDAAADQRLAAFDGALQHVGDSLLYEVESAHLQPYIDQYLPDGHTLLTQAANAGDARRVMHLLNLGANVHKPHKSGASALHGAVRAKHPEIVEILLKHGARPAQSDGQYSAVLLHGIGTRSPSIVQLLLEHGAQACQRWPIAMKELGPGLTEVNYRWPLDSAVATGNAEICQLVEQFATHPAFVSSREMAEHRALHAHLELLARSYTFSQPSDDESMQDEGSLTGTDSEDSADSHPVTPRSTDTI